MDSLRYLTGTSVVLGAVLGLMSQFIFRLPMFASIGIAASTMIGLFMITLVLNSITFKRSIHDVEIA